MDNQGMGASWNVTEGIDAVELSMAVEEALGRPLSGEEGERLLADIAQLIARGEFGDDDPLAIAVRILGPRGPRGLSGATARTDQ